MEKRSKKQRQGKRSTQRAKPRRRRGEPAWSEYSDDELLDLRLCDLGIKIQGTELQGRIERLYEELEAREIRFRPHCWLSDDWFSPDGIPGIAIPFYLAHPRLSRLERKQMFEVEGGSHEWCMRILRHEAGHTIDTAYRLHRRRRWREMFGPSSTPYPEYYQPKPYSKSYVVHLESWYAQSHPAEDFAETFAVWLKPRSRWRAQYSDWPAMKKLRYVDEVMQGIRNRQPLVKSRQHMDPVRTLKKTLREHYAEKRERYGIGEDHSYDRHLRRLFSDAPEHGRNSTAASFFRKNRRELRQVVSQWTGQYQYTIDQVLSDMIDRCRQLKLRLAKSEEKTKQDAMVMLTAQTMNYLQAGHHKVAL